MSEKVLVLGAGESGCGAAYLAKKKGFEVILSEFSAISDENKAFLNQHDIPFEEGKHSENHVKNADLVIKSPGIPDKSPIIQSILEKGKPLISEIEFAYRYIDSGKIIAITGSNGKTTTTSLIHHIISQLDNSVCLAGNIGLSLAKQVADRQFDYYVLELSSFQLDHCIDFKPDVAIILNITPDHLDRYADFSAYADAKWKLAQNLKKGDTLITWADDKHLQRTVNEDVNHLKFSTTQQVQGYKSNDNLMVNANQTEWKFDLNACLLKGEHNQLNMMASALATQALGLPKHLISQSFSNFSGVEHRLEFVLSHHNIDYINDSKATNVDAVFYALGAFEKPIIWIAGGVDKGNDYQQIKALVEQKVKTVICLGEDSKALETHFGKSKPFFKCETMEQALKQAQTCAQSGDVVLLSPACASFDLFDNYEHRGEVFKTTVKTLTSCDY
ncbi:MAG: UDP-N-acetylmuramoyl-L-alanine--D-glutamate ligase [Flavobacteriales bacterium]